MTDLTRSISYATNITIVVLTFILVVRFFRENGKWSPARGKDWAYYLKVMGTAAVTVTMLTVLIFLGRIYGYKPLLSGSDLFMHLITPLLAIISLCVFERRGISFLASFIGVIPVALYAPLYLYNVVYAPEEKRWEDFYGFNRDGKWPVAYALMVAGVAVICVVYCFVLNL